MFLAGGRPVTIRILGPLRVRDFRLLWAGMTISALGDGIYTVALAWQVYDISNTPTALSLVGVAWFLPQIAAVLLAGVIADRVDRRWLMVAADIMRAVAIGVMGILSVAGQLQLWHVWVLVALYGIGNSFFYPAYTALVPQVLPKDQLVQAAALRQFVRPLSMRVIGPALGGAIVAAAGPGTGFLIDAGSFAASTAALLLMSSYPLVHAAGRTVGTVLGDMSEGLRYVLSLRWLSLTLLAVTISMVFFLGPVFVLMPFVVKNHIHGGAGGLGLVLAAGGIGALIASVSMAQQGLPRRPLFVVYVAWAIAAFCLIGYAESDAVWEAALVSRAVGRLPHHRPDPVGVAPPALRPGRVSGPSGERRLLRLVGTRSAVARDHRAGRRRARDAGDATLGGRDLRRDLACLLGHRRLRYSTTTSPGPRTSVSARGPAPSAAGS